MVLSVCSNWMPLRTTTLLWTQPTTWRCWLGQSSPPWPACPLYWSGAGTSASPELNWLRGGARRRTSRESREELWLQWAPPTSLEQLWLQWAPPTSPVCACCVSTLVAAGVLVVRDVGQHASWWLSIPGAGAFTQQLSKGGYRRHTHFTQSTSIPTPPCPAPPRPQVDPWCCRR